MTNSVFDVLVNRWFFNTGFKPLVIVPMGMKPTTVRLPDPLEEALQEEADRTGRQKSEIQREALQNHLEV